MVHTKFNDEVTKLEGFFFMYRGNGYGPYGTEDEAQIGYKIKSLEGDRTYRTKCPPVIYEGWVEVNSRKKLSNENLKRVYPKDSPLRKG